MTKTETFAEPALKSGDYFLAGANDGDIMVQVYRGGVKISRDYKILSELEEKKLIANGLDPIEGEIGGTFFVRKDNPNGVVFESEFGEDVTERVKPLIQEIQESLRKKYPSLSF